VALHLSAVDWDALVGFDPRLTGYLFCRFIFEQVQLLSKRGTLETTEASLGIFEENSQQGHWHCADDPKYEGPREELKADFVDQYRDVQEEIDPSPPKPIGTPLETTIFFDSDHAHDTKTRRSIMGISVVVGLTPVTWFSKRQGAVEASTYSAEFCNADGCRGGC